MAINRRHLLILGSVLGSLWLWVAFDRPTPLAVLPLYYNNHDPKLTDLAIDIFDFPALDSWVIRDVCESTVWNSSLIFTCDNNHGGVGHVRNSILNCVRFAISAGAALVMPNIALREDDDWNMMEPDHHKRHGPGRKGIDYMFDKQHFVYSLRHSCPELRLIDEMEQYSGGRRHALFPESLEKTHPVTGLEKPNHWHHTFHTWLDNTIPHYRTHEPIVIDLEQSFLVWPTHSDGHAFAHSFGRILKFRSDVRRLATQTLKQLGHWYDLHLNLSAPIMPNSFLAAHLRTHSPIADLDAAPVPLGKRHSDITYAHYEAQAETYLQSAKALNLSIMYIASGNLSAIHKLIPEAETLGISITHKEELLKSEDREELEMLRWDQRALVDFLVAERAQEFVGVGHSSFSWNVVLRRHEWAAAKGRLEGDQPDGIWGDGTSGLFGVRKGYVESSGCMWP